MWWFAKIHSAESVSEQRKIKDGIIEIDSASLQNRNIHMKNGVVKWREKQNETGAKTIFIGFEM